MRHRKRRGSLGRMSDHRDATLQNLVRGLFRSQRICTTLRKAKEARRLADRLITLGKTDDLASRRRAYSILTDRSMVSKLFKEIAPLFKDRAGGYTRIIHFGFRRGDGASMAILELTAKKTVEKPQRKRRLRKSGEEATAVREPSKEPSRKDRPAKDRKGVEDAKADKKPETEKKEEIGESPKAKPALKEEKAQQKAKAEERKIKDQKGFLKNLRGFFRRKTNM